MPGRILVVDDSAFMRMMLRDILTKAQYEIAGEADSGEKAIAVYREAKPDLVTMDLIMSQINGIDALKKIIASDPSAKVIMVSAMGQETLVDEAMTAGAKGFIVKPFEPAKVIEKIREILG